MLNYAVIKIGGAQYKIEPEKEILVSLLGNIKNFESDQVMIMMNDGKLTIGQPFLKDKLKFEVVGESKAIKIRVATYHAKANSRKVKGSKQKLSRIKLVE